MSANTTGTSNVAVGATSLYANTTADNNVAVGRNAMVANVDGHSNVAVGSYALDANIDADGNTAVGYYAGSGVTTGGANTLIGYQAGLDTVTLTTGYNNVVIGKNTRTSAVDSVNQIVIGEDIGGGEDNQVTIGKSGNVIQCEFDTDATWTRTSDFSMKQDIQDDILGLSFINDLRPVTFKWRPSYEFPKEWNDYSEDNLMNTDATMHGMVAQDVKSALDKAGVDTFGGWKERADGSQVLGREMFVLPLIKAVQELSAEVEELKSKMHDKCEE